MSPTPTHRPTRCRDGTGGRLRTIARVALLVLVTSALGLLAGTPAWAMHEPEAPPYDYIPPLHPAAATVPVAAFVAVAVTAALVGVAATLALQFVLDRGRVTPALA